MSDFAFKPDPKIATGKGGTGQKKYKARRKAGAARWQEIRERKLGPCRVCKGESPAMQLHHLVPRAHLGADCESNLVPLCATCHDKVTRHDRSACAALRQSLTDAEYSYATEKLGETVFER